MFKSWSKKNKIKAVFKLEFQATQVPKMKKNALMVSLVPDDVGKPTVKLEKTAVQDGTCLWENPIFESVKLVRDSKSGILHEKIYHFIVATGSSKSGYLGEASIDFADFLTETEPITVSLPLKFANSGVVLHVTIQNVEGYTAERNGEDNGAVEIYNDGSLKHQLSYGSTDESYNLDENSNLAKSRSDASNGISPGVASWDDPYSFRQNSMPPRGTVEANATQNQVHKRSNTGWSMGSASDGSLGDWTNGTEDNFPRERLQEPSGNGNATENLKSEIVSLKRQAELSELELQALRKQVEKESSRGQNLSRQINGLRDERDSLKTKYEQLKSQQNFNNNSNNETKTSKSLKSDIDNTRLQLDAIKEELVYEKEMSGNLQLQLQKTQNSNSELLLAVTDLEAMLEQKNKEILDLSSNRKSQKITKERDNDTELNVLRQKIADQNSEIENCYKQREELSELIKELTVEYDLLKNENVDISLRLKQDEAQHIMLQNEHSASLVTIQQLESQVKRLEEKIEMQEDEFSSSLVSIKELENQVKSLEKELRIQADKFEDELQAMQSEKTEQEERAIQAEESLRKTRHNNAIASEQLQEEYKLLSVEMSCKVEENEKMITKAIEEADELRNHNRLMEEMLQKCNQELRQISDQHELKVEELLKQISTKEKTMEQMSQELDVKTKELEDAQRHRDEKDAALSKQIQMLEIQHNEMKHSLQKEQVDKENMKKHISQLEGEVKKKEAELNAMEKKLKNNRGRGAAMTSRDNEAAKANAKKSKSEMHKGMDAASTGISKSEGSDAERLTKELLNEVAVLKERNTNMETELKEMEERYSEISLKFAEVEGERQQLVMAVRNLKNGKKN